MLVSDILFRTARDRADQPAVWFEGTWRTYGELSRAAGALGDFLTRANLLPGERVAILLDNSFDYIIAHFGALAAGAVEVSLNTDLRPEDLKSLLQDCEAAVLVAGHKHAPQWAPILEELPALRLVITDGAPDQTAGSACQDKCAFARRRDRAEATPETSLPLESLRTSRRLSIPPAPPDGRRA